MQKREILSIGLFVSFIFTGCGVEQFGTHVPDHSSWNQPQKEVQTPPEQRKEPKVQERSEPAPKTPEEPPIEVVKPAIVSVWRHPAEPGHEDGTGHWDVGDKNLNFMKAYISSDKDILVHEVIFANGTKSTIGDENISNCTLAVGEELEGNYRHYKGRYLKDKCVFTFDDPLLFKGGAKYDVSLGADLSFRVAGKKVSFRLIKDGKWLIKASDVKQGNPVTFDPPASQGVDFGSGEPQHAETAPTDIHGSSVYISECPTGTTQGTIGVNTQIACMNVLVNGEGVSVPFLWFALRTNVDLKNFQNFKLWDGTNLVAQAASIDSNGEFVFTWFTLPKGQTRLRLTVDVTGNAADLMDEVVQVVLLDVKKRSRMYGTRSNYDTTINNVGELTFTPIQF